MKHLIPVMVILLMVSTSFIGVSSNVEKSAASLNGKTLYVGGSGPGNYTTIQHAVNDANEGDIIYVYNGTYKENIEIDKSISIIGEDRNSTVVKGVKEPTYHTFYLIADDINIEGLSIQNGWSGIHVFCGDTTHRGITIKDCNIVNNQNFFGGISFRGQLLENVLIENCYFNNNEGLAIRIEITLENIKISNCYFDGDEILGHNVNKMIFENCKFLHSEISLRYISNNVHFNNCRFESTDEIYLYIYGSGQVIENCTFTNSYSEAIQLYESKNAIVRNCIIRNDKNFSGGNGISIWHANNILIDNCIFEDMRNGLFVIGPHWNIIVKDCHFENNSVGIKYLFKTIGNRIVRNNFINNEKQFAVQDAWWLINFYNNNYWSDWDGDGAYHVYGLLNWDWNPVSKPYDIGV